jgi:hypothetical protein
MGANLCGFILCGPRKIAPDKIEAAIKHVEETLKLLKVLVDGEPHAKETEELEKRLPCFDPRYPDAHSAYADEDPKVLVFNFVDMWENEPYRDMMSCYFPGDRDKKIIACGERTWGDGPEPDSAWGITEKAELLDIPQMLGIE